jgi:hypothetical protein
MYLGGEPPQLIVRGLKIPSVHPPKIPLKILHLSISLCLFISTVPQLIPPPQLRPLHKVSQMYLSVTRKLLPNFPTEKASFFASRLIINPAFVSHCSSGMISFCIPSTLRYRQTWLAGNSSDFVDQPIGKCEKITNLQQTQVYFNVPMKNPMKNPNLI